MKMIESNNANDKQHISLEQFIHDKSLNLLETQCKINKMAEKFNFYKLFGVILVTVSTLPFMCCELISIPELLGMSIAIPYITMSILEFFAKKTIINLFADNNLKPQIKTVITADGSAKNIIYSYDRASNEFLYKFIDNTQEAAIDYYAKPFLDSHRITVEDAFKSYQSHDDYHSVNEVEVEASNMGEVLV